MSLSEKEIFEESEKLIMAINELTGRPGIGYSFYMKAQGYHPEFGGTTVVKHFKKELKDAKYILQCILFNSPNDEVDDFVNRCIKKVKDAYCCKIEVEGKDGDGDSIGCEMEFKDQKQFLMFLQTGIFSMENPDHNKYLLVDIFDR